MNYRNVILAFCNGMWHGAHVPRSSTYPLYDRILDGRLTELLADWRADGLSYEAIADKLRNDHGFKVTASTIYRWMLTEDDDEDGAA